MSTVYYYALRFVDPSPSVRLRAFEELVLQITANVRSSDDPDGYTPGRINSMLRHAALTHLNGDAYDVRNPVVFIFEHKAGGYFSHAGWNPTLTIDDAYAYPILSGWGYPQERTLTLDVRDIDDVSAAFCSDPIITSTRSRFCGVHPVKSKRKITVAPLP